MHVEINNDCKILKKYTPLLDNSTVRLYSTVKLVNSHPIPINPQLCAASIMAMAPGKQGGETTEVPAKNTRDFENPLRSMLTISRMTVNNDKLLQVDNHSTTNDENGSDNRHDNNLAPNSHTVDSNPIPQLPVLEEGEGQNRSCLDATLSRLVKALVSACLASASLTNPAQTPDTSRPPSVEEVAGTVVTPLMLQSSKGAGTEECRDSARALLRFFGHSPLLHVEGVIWFKMSGKKGKWLIDQVQHPEEVACVFSRSALRGTIEPCVHKTH